MTIRLSNLALDDLGSIHAYTHERWGAEQAEKYIGMLWDAMESISSAPERWRLRNHLHPGCRICLAGSHAILYRLRDGRIEIARVLHGSMDLPSHVPKNFMTED